MRFGIRGLAGFIWTRRSLPSVRNANPAMGERDLPPPRMWHQYNFCRIVVFLLSLAFRRK